MKFTRISVITGKTRTLDLPVTPDQLKAYQDGELIQRAMPHLTPSQREFILTGCTDEEWDTLKDPDDNPPNRGK